ncbi:ionotropic receptor 21a isoform X5 [Drosophila sechellia]|uniref:ionotropic receptor 21a isoform X5 n=1 Tax=Drosophila sechellia TaxID=7238 RepID=UPI0013DDE33B|nr:ionotropic receptor 21a isoform X5 [Drosophila sechellia]
MSYYWIALVLFTAQAFSIEGDTSASYQEKCVSRRLINHYQLNNEIFGVGMCDGNNENEFRQKRRIVPTFHGNPRPRGELLASSIIAFVTLPAFPDTVDSVLDLLGLFFRVGTLNNGGWETWFQNSTHIPTSRLYKKMEFVGSIDEGIGNVTQSFFWNYAFLGSKAQLEYLVQSNFSDENISRRSALHLSEECFALFQIGFLFPRESVYKIKIDSMILLAQQSGLIAKINNEVSWAMQRSSSGRLLQASSSNSLREIIQEERQLTTADTEGMFLLMALGYFLGATALVSEIVGGITNKCRQIIKRSRKSAASSWSSGSSGSMHRTNAEQLSHDKRKANRRQAADVAQKMSFGMRELNLTRATLREIYGSYGAPGIDHGQLDIVHAEFPSSSANLNSIEDEESQEAIESLQRLDEFMDQMDNDGNPSSHTFRIDN